MFDSTRRKRDVEIKLQRLRRTPQRPKRDVGFGILEECDLLAGNAEKLSELGLGQSEFMTTPPNLQCDCEGRRDTNRDRSPTGSTPGLRTRRCVPVLEMHDEPPLQRLCGNSVYRLTLSEICEGLASRAIRKRDRHLPADLFKLRDVLHTSLHSIVIPCNEPSRPGEAAGLTEARLQTAAAYRAGVQVKPFDVEVTAPHFDTAQFHIRQEPYTVRARLTRQPVGDSMMLAVVVALDTIPVSVRVGCRDPGSAGIREASVMVLTPPWAAVRFGDVAQDPALCNPASSSDNSTARRRFSWAPIALGLGRTIGPGPSGWTAQLGTAIVFGAR